MGPTVSGDQKISSCTCLECNVVTLLTEISWLINTNMPHAKYAFGTNYEST
jgi:ferredoxin-like protein FixX